MRNGSVWKDMDGNYIQAHGGCIIKYNDMYYWYGEHKGQDNCPGYNRVDIIGVSCYSSLDLLSWKYEGLALEADKDKEDSMLHPSGVLERPKVIYNDKTKQFVMWMHLDNADYTYAGVGVAVSEHPVGPFRFLYAKHPNRQDSRDMTLFKDENGKAYLIHSKDWNKTLNIAELTDDYTDVCGVYVSVMQEQEREAPAMFKYNGMYYMITSGCTGWEPNAALYAQCLNVMGQWKLIDNPCRGDNKHNTFNGQGSYVFETNGRFYLMIDHWEPDNLQLSAYSILPIKFDKYGNMIIKWTDDWEGIKNNDKIH